METGTISFKPLALDVECFGKWVTIYAVDKETLEEIKATLTIELKKHMYRVDYTYAIEHFQKLHYESEQSFYQFLSDYSKKAGVFSHLLGSVDKHAKWRREQKEAKEEKEHLKFTHRSKRIDLEEELAKLYKRVREIEIECGELYKKEMEII